MMGTKVGHVVIEADGGVVRATIDRPEVKNAIDDGVIQGLEAVVEQAELERARVLVLRGAGGTFCAGADLRHILSLIDDRTALEGYVTRLSDVLERLERAPFASVCVIEG
ncbi:MAG: enoyl-CoA hydratase/isomerase family protein, partial [Armatimonadota bacterium]